jgi:hypothetical protein
MFRPKNKMNIKYEIGGGAVWIHKYKSIVNGNEERGITYY